MTRKLIALILLLCTACMLVPAQAEESAAGRWAIEEMTVDGVTYPPDVLGMNWTFDLREDGTAGMTQETNGEKHEGTGTWQQSGETLLITVEGTGLPATVAEGRLTISADNVVAVFTRETAYGAEEPAAAGEIAAGNGGPEEGISWGMNPEQVKDARKAQQKRPGSIRLSEDTEGGHPVVYCTVMGSDEDRNGETAGYTFDAESGGLVFAYYSFMKATAETRTELRAEYDGTYTAGDSAAAGKLLPLLSVMYPEEDPGNMLPGDTQITGWKDADGTGIWMAWSGSAGLLMVFRASPELTESVR